MPYSSNDELPPAVKKLPAPMQNIWRSAFNAALKEYKNEQRAFAVAWAAVNKQREDLHPQFQRIKALFAKKYPAEGVQRFLDFITNNGLDPSQSYREQGMRRAMGLQESFTWAKSGLKYLRSDAEAKYYAVDCLDAIVSFNNKDYTDIEALRDAAKSLNYRPINLNHDHTKWLPFPRTRLDYSKAEDATIEGILRVDNEDAWLQKMLDHDESISEKEWIWHPSIEGRPDLDGKGYHLQALSLLQMGRAVPGDPLSAVEPLFVESVGATSCFLIEGVKICLEDEIQSKVSEDVSTNEKPEPVKESTATPEQASLRAEYAENILAHQKNEERQSNELTALREDLAKSQEASAKLERENATITEMKASTGELSEKVAKERTEHAQTRGELMEAKKLIESINTRMKLKDGELDRLNEAIGALKSQLSEAIARGNEALEKSATSTQKAINETQERARIQTENAGLREQVARGVREVSDLTTKRAEDSKRYLGVESELAEAKRSHGVEMATLTEQVTKQNALIDTARKYQKWANKVLAEAGIVVETESQKPNV